MEYYGIVKKYRGNRKANRPVMEQSLRYSKWKIM